MPRAHLAVPLRTMATAVFLAVGTALAAASPTELLLNPDELSSGARSKPRPTKREHRDKAKREGKLPKFHYILDESDPDILILRRQGGSFVATFSAAGATKEGIVEAAMEDYRTLVWPHEGKHGQTAEEGGTS
jgi:hypothetical protein